MRVRCWRSPPKEEPEAPLPARQDALTLLSAPQFPASPANVAEPVHGFAYEKFSGATRRAVHTTDVRTWLATFVREAKPHPCVRSAASRQGTIPRARGPTASPHRPAAWQPLRQLTRRPDRVGR